MELDPPPPSHTRQLPGPEEADGMELDPTSPAPRVQTPPSFNLSGSEVHKPKKFWLQFSFNFTVLLIY